MKLERFIFSAHSIQDFLKCPRRFELKYILNQAWPAPISEPVLEFENKMKLGTDFHHLVHQYLSGIDAEKLKQLSLSQELNYWFVNFLKFFTNHKFNYFFSEISITLPFQESIIKAVIDFVGVNEKGQLIIAEWKTSEFLPKREMISNTVQSILYPFMIYVCRNNIFPDINIDHEDIKMVYWFPNHPEKLIALNYSREKHDLNRRYLADVINRIQNTQSGSFNKTENLKSCSYCEFRSLCERGIKPGYYDTENPDLDFDQLIADIQFEDSLEISF